MTQHQIVSVSPDPARDNSLNEDQQLNGIKRG